MYLPYIRPLYQGSVREYILIFPMIKPTFSRDETSCVIGKSRCFGKPMPQWIHFAEAMLPTFVELLCQEICPSFR